MFKSKEDKIKEIQFKEFMIPKGEREIRKTYCLGVYKVFETNSETYEIYQEMVDTQTGMEDYKDTEYNKRFMKNLTNLPDFFFETDYFSYVVNNMEEQKKFVKQMFDEVTEIILELFVEHNEKMDKYLNMTDEQREIRAKIFNHEEVVKNFKQVDMEMAYDEAIKMNEEYDEFAKKFKK